MKITTSVDLDAIPHGILQLRNAVGDQIGVVVVGRVRVGSGHDVGRAGFTRHAGHVQAYVERRRPVVETGQNVGMNINHGEVTARLKSEGAKMPVVSEPPMRVRVPRRRYPWAAPYTD